MYTIYRILESAIYLNIDLLYTSKSKQKFIVVIVRWEIFLGAKYNDEYEKIQRTSIKC